MSLPSGQELSDPGEGQPETPQRDMGLSCIVWHSGL